MRGSEDGSLESNDEIDLLDLLLVIAENIRLIILVPLVVGVLSLAFSFTLPETFESKSLLNPNKPGLNIPGQVLASYLKSANILEAAGVEAKIDVDATPAHLIKKMESLVQATVGKQDSLVALTTYGPSPEKAQKLNQLLWKTVLPHTIPRGTDMDNLQEQLQAEEARLQAGNALEASTAKILQTNDTNESTARLYGELLASNSARLKNIANLKSQIEGLTLDNLSQPPTLDELPIKPKKSLIAIACTLAAGVLVLLFIFARHALRNSENNPEQAEKIKKLRAALRFKH